MSSSSSANQVPWTIQEEEVLAESWIITTKKYHGKFSGSQFWDMVSYCFHLPPKRVEERSSDDLCDKWLDLKKKTSAFSVIYDNVYNNREMVWNDIDIMTKAQEQYHSKMGSTFNHVSFWKIIKDYM
ncbi:hypothetical protein R6Q59_021044 [Mikania micrantha]